MSSFISHTAIDCGNAYELSEWWKGVLAYVDIDGDPNLPGHAECMIVSPETGHKLLFIEVPEGAKNATTPADGLPGPQTVKNRLHLDLRPRHGSRDDEVAALLERGATQVADRRGISGPGSGWVVLADPEGNEFCVLRSEAELA
jgi:hypothetical protein